MENRALLIEYRALLKEYRDLLSEYRSLLWSILHTKRHHKKSLIKRASTKRFSINRALFLECRALLIECRSLLIEYRSLFLSSLCTKRHQKRSPAISPAKVI